ncbi:MAG: glycerol-3-phosphate 1-O-acyltransferase PlsY [Phycisphaerales bacterium]
MTTTLLIAIPIAYLLGAIPFGFLIARAKGIDIRQHGSKNIGATNVRRVLGPSAGNLCLALDMLKGFIPVIAAGAAAALLTNPIPSPAIAALWLAVAIAAVIGHMYPIYLALKGGKGVATGFGAILALWPLGTIAALTALFVWIATVKITRFVSIASCAAALALPIAATAAALLAPALPIPTPTLPIAWPMVAGFAAIAILVLYKHRANIARVRAGTEPRTNRPASGDRPPTS